MGDDKKLQEQVFYSRGIIIAIMGYFFSLNKDKESTLSVKEYVESNMADDPKLKALDLHKEFKDLDLNRDNKVDLAGEHLRLKMARLEFLVAFFKEDAEDNYSDALIFKEARDHVGVLE
ncbi:hypothetical protein P170DRAFT_476279 [Aspergillus steynii IBT 23096]|uniref:EF-hand domain-containing protein n=1 Tax=Aspergillus steynii IBT 23096 TaxID=1392250 RepID=A0A2I2G3Z4_9EURO|nr:uncharacterized protein P170DRAFT_476279 [Aspergillus steynii IBT 23096]PLB47597.1 hypothetical protein P170DRAFT_476279 [Aspergillus steynii IBT 23096]